MAITFAVSDVERARAPLRMPPGQEARRFLGSPVEAWGSSAASPLPASEHGLLQAIHWAFALHYPLVLTPDAVWLCIAQGFAAHVNENAERLRGKFVRHKGRVPISIERNDFRKGAPDNPWPEVFQAFSDGIAAHIGRQRDLVVCDFSTTGPCERAASEIVLMDAMQQYFEYRMSTLCGIPEITLEGTVDDWASIRRRVKALEEYDLDFWITGLAPVLDKLVATAKGQIDVAFWRSLFKLHDRSGGPLVTGWINTLFPYLRSDDKRRRNEWVSTWAAGLSKGAAGGPKESEIPVGLSIAPFKWSYLGSIFPMELLGGFVGVAQDADTLALRPAIGWAVRDADASARQATPEEPQPRALWFDAHSRGAALLVGRAALGDTVTQAEVMGLARRLKDLGESLGVSMRCAVFSDKLPLFPLAPMPGKLVIGVLLTSITTRDDGLAPAGDLRRALEKLSAVPESIWAEIAALTHGGLTGETAVHLWCHGANVRGNLVYGEPTGSGNALGIEVARVSASGPRHVVVDASAAAHDARKADAQAAGVRSGAYYLSVSEAI